jgi:glycosyltransferase involved in cell wall biosynthesis
VSSRRIRVSAIIIVFNGETFLEEAVESVLAQSFTDWELIIVDDGSTDGTADLAARLILRDPDRIMLLAHPDRGNHGMSASRNLGVAHARGEYVGFVDADDVWLPQKLSEQVAILDAEPADGMVYGRTLIWYSWDPAGAEKDHFYSLGVEPDRSYPPPRLFNNLMLNRFQTPTTCNALVRRTAIEAVGGFDPAFRDLFEDQLFFAKIMLKFPVHVCSKTWAKYRQHSAASSAAFSDKVRVIRAHVHYLRVLRRFVRDHSAILSPPRLALERKLAALRIEEVRKRARHLLSRMRKC